VDERGEVARDVRVIERVGCSQVQWNVVGRRYDRTCARCALGVGILFVAW
jgi:hypothetical protein